MNVYLTRGALKELRDQAARAERQQIELAKAKVLIRQLHASRQDAR